MTSETLWKFYNIITILLIIIYFTTFIQAVKYDERYILLLNMIAKSLIAGVLIWFYNPLRSRYIYPDIIPNWAFAAGIAILLTIRPSDIQKVLTLFDINIKVPDPMQQAS